MHKLGLHLIFLCTAVLNYGCAATKHAQREYYFPKQELKVVTPPDKKHVWIFVMAGQSNMAGRGLVEAQDTVADNRIFTLNKNNELVIAKEPLHYYEPSMTGLDCGLSFAKALLKKIPENISILMLPAAVGGSSITQWTYDSLHRNIFLLTNFKNKLAAAKKYGILKGIIWHQGESDTSPEKSALYEQRLINLIQEFRKIGHDEHLPFVAGTLPDFQIYNKAKEIKNTGALALNESIKDIKNHVLNYSFVSLADGKHRGDGLHLNSSSLRIMGRKYAEEMYQLINQ